MKIKGRTLKANEEVLVLPRPDGPIVLKFRALSDIDEFEKMVPDPKPPMGRNKEGKVAPDYEDANFKEAAKRKNDQSYNYMVLASLSATEDLEWDKVKMDQPATYHLWEEELKEAGFSQWEVQRIKASATSVNGLNEAKIAAAREAFLATQVEQADQ